jgi:TatD DNase family protein
MPPVWFDTHAHLQDDAFAQDLEEVLARAEAAGVRYVLTVGTTAETSAQAAALAQKHVLLAAAVGIQPNHAAQAQPGDWERIAALAQSPGVVALGETGLDRYWHYTPWPVQVDYFQRHLDLARQTGLPVVIHCRDAFPETLDLLQHHAHKHGPIRGVMHSFTGDLDAARQCLRLGLHLSFAGMVTYRNAEPLRHVAAQVPLDRLLLETDSPYLVPVPLRNRQRRNEPAHLPHIAACVARLHQVSEDVLAQATTANAFSLFGDWRSR